MKKNKVGRKTLMVESVVKKLEEAFAWGCTDKEACAYVDITPATLYNYQAKCPKFLERKEMLKQSPILLARKTVVDALENNPDLALKFLERKKKDEFSLRTEMTGEAGKPIEVLAMDKFEKMSDEELDQYLARLR